MAADHALVHRRSGHHHGRGRQRHPCEPGRPVLDLLDAGRSAGRPPRGVFTVVQEVSRQLVESPAVCALRDGVSAGLAHPTLLLAKDGTERTIEGGAAPVRNAAGEVIGVVLAFRDITEGRRREQAVRDALAYADNILATLREPFVVLDPELRVRTANESFYRTFRVSKEETENHSLFELGDGQWDIPRLRKVLADVLRDGRAVEDIEIEHAFPTIGNKVLRLNARRIASADRGPAWSCSPSRT